MKKLLVLFILFFSVKAHSQWALLYNDADSLIRTGANYIYNVQFDSAEVCFQKVITKYPNQPAGYFLSAMIDWWKITLYRETDYFDESFKKKIKKVIEVSDLLLEGNPYDLNGLFFKAGALGYRGRFYAEKKEWINAASDGSQAFELMLKCYETAPGNHDIMLGTGIYNYFAEAIPEKYPFTKPLLYFLPKGDKKIGLLQLRAASHHARYAAIEADVVLLQIYYSFEKDNKKALEKVEELFDKYPNNPYFHRYLGRVYVRLGQVSKFEKIWREILIRALDNWNGYGRLTVREGLYYVGYGLYRQSKYDDALKYFYKCDEASRAIDEEPSGFMVETNIHIARIYEKQKKISLAINQYEKLLKMKEYNNSHSKAKSRLKYLKSD